MKGGDYFIAKTDRYAVFSKKWMSNILNFISKDKKMAKCKTCNGKGNVDCPICKGKGRTDRLLGGSNQCKNCNGSGKVKCSVCNGKGVI
ncbi:hypothetical protein DSCO28_36600 [Desulfosarcina ovata subsp. sediminis]|uniref:CR-type domain-containing protein n=1 Tax=Desulfosarcina ovata subsp. sediminis TaxID=885957 RepID=A0A5K7ZSC6_9BACT|nr:YuiA family protein [Desulfosarcina ovata]BBO83094.1 hypothetical protein DSCO28_36600 [Desulfosarcina ovata subsp. sediminis]